MPSRTMDEVTTVSPEDLARASLAVLRAFAAIADDSLSDVAPAMTLQQFRALTILHELGPQNAASLAAALGIAPSTLTRLANRLVRDGLIDRVTDPTDRRAVVLSITRRGTRTAERVKSWRLRKLADAFRRAAESERPAMATALARAGELFGAEER